jgi:hypothetical protein
MPLTPEEREILRSLSEPLERDRRPAFLQEAVKRIEEASPGEIGAGLVHRIGRTTQRDFYDPPQDLRQGRLGPRGPRG